MTPVESAATVLLAFYALDRAGKWAAVSRFFARPAPPEPEAWPEVALIQPVTRGASELAANLRARGAQDYPVGVRHLIVCDAADVDSQATCRAALPQAEVILVSPDVAGSPVASKIAKMVAGEQAAGSAAIVCFIDDDIGLPPHGLRTLVRHLLGTPRAGAVFGLACHTCWDNLPSALLSAFVNAHALTGYIPLSLLTEPYTITGHVFALRRSDFAAIGGARALVGRFDDDHEIARRVRGRLGLVCVQTPLMYGVANRLPTLRAYAVQMRRWFTMPRVAMLPHLTPRERAVTALLSLGNLLPALLLLLALWWYSPATAVCAASAFALFAAGYAVLEARHLPARLPVRWLWLLPVVAFLTPLHTLALCLLPIGTVKWRGRRLTLRPDGGFEEHP